MDEEYRILVVDDDPSQLSLNKHELEREGLVVDPYINPHEALENAEEADAVLTDYQMPGMNGYEMWRELQDQKPETPVLFLTGNPDEVLSQSDEVTQEEVFSKESLGVETYDQIVEALESHIGGF
ncbi:MAG: response regulator [Candidatus Nanohalobium sp.]